MAKKKTRYVVKVTDSKRFIICQGPRKVGSGKDAEWVNDNANVVRIAEEYAGDDGEWRPGKGVSLPTSVIPRLLAKLTAAIEAGTFAGLSFEDGEIAYEAEDDDDE